ncbi:enoyl-CoA hydratase-related protein, partial [Rhizorhabdus wittichii]
TQVLADLIVAFRAFDADPEQRCAILTGSEKAFAAGGDIKQMREKGYAEMFGEDVDGWSRVTGTRKPWIAA